jgi:hypothetical protein
MSNAVVVNVNVKSLRANTKFNSFEEWEKDASNVYIGRANMWVKAKKSKWANPFSTKKFPLEECLKKYEEHLLSKPELMNSLGELKGKNLGCWCKPNACHGDILLKYVNTVQQDH